MPKHGSSSGRSGKSMSGMQNYGGRITGTTNSRGPSPHAGVKPSPVKPSPNAGPVNRAVSGAKPKLGDR